MKTAIVMAAGVLTVALGSATWHLIAVACFADAARPGWFLALSVSSVAMTTIKAIVQANNVVEKL